MKGPIQRLRKDARLRHRAIGEMNATAERLLESAVALRARATQSSDAHVMQSAEALISATAKTFTREIRQARQQVRKILPPAPSKQQVRQYWAQVAADIRAGDLHSFDEALAGYGPRAFVAPEIQDVLNDLWVKSLGDTKARASFRKIGSMLVGLVGRPPTLSDAESKSHKRTSNLTTQQTGRARRYCDKAWVDYFAGKQAHTEFASDPLWLRQLATNIDCQHFTRDTVAKREAQRQFWEKIKIDLAEAKATVSKNSR